MFALPRLLGKPRSSRRKTQMRLGLEHLEGRETPAIVVVGGWGSSMYQYAIPSASANRPMESLSLNFTKVTYENVTRAAADYLLTLDGVQGESSAAALEFHLKLDGVQGESTDRGRTVADDVIVDGRIITAENPDSASGAHGYIRIKKLNSGG